jgi:hypothetical protein
VVSQEVSREERVTVRAVVRILFALEPGNRCDEASAEREMVHFS